MCWNLKGKSYTSKRIVKVQKHTTKTYEEAGEESVGGLRWSRNNAFFLQLF